jgi:hypothetical protein
MTQRKLDVHEQRNNHREDDDQPDDGEDKLLGVHTTLVLFLFSHLSGTPLAYQIRFETHTDRSYYTNKSYPFNLVHHYSR